jgi:hypothetical protein
VRKRRDVKFLSYEFGAWQSGTGAEDSLVNRLSILRLSCHHEDSHTSY